MNTVLCERIGKKIFQDINFIHTDILEIGHVMETRSGDILGINYQIIGY
jgi:hypothetical protein